MQEIGSTTSKPGPAHLAWIVGAAALGFLVSFVFASQLRLSRQVFLIPHVVCSGFFALAYLRWSGVSILMIFRRSWRLGLVLAVPVAAFLVRNVLSQTGSGRPEGPALYLDLLWSGLVYASADTLLLSLVPVLAILGALSATRLARTRGGRAVVGVIAVLASLFVTTCYHLGFPEYRSAGIVGPVIGNGIMSLGYVLSGNPLTAWIGHIAMHVAGLLHGAATVIQLPPHYLP